MEMPQVPLVLRRWLDPREMTAAAQRPIDDAVNLPLAELPRRMHELPPKDRLISVAGPAELARETVSFLRAQGRRAEAAASFQWMERRDSGPPAAIGRLWEPNAFLAAALPQLPPRSALDLACGTGRDAVFLASQGWRATGVDRLPDALELARDLARRCAAAIAPMEWACLDLENNRDEPAHGRPFDLVTIFRYLHRPLLRRLAAWLAPGGSVLIETFTATHRQRHGKPGREAFVLQAGELREFFRDWDVRHSSEDWRGDTHTARLWAVRAE